MTPEGTEYPNGTLTMATNAYFPPYEYYEGDEIVGIDAEFAKAICDYLGYELVIEDMEFASIIPAINSGKADRHRGAPGERGLHRQLLHRHPVRSGAEIRAGNQRGFSV